MWIESDTRAINIYVFEKIGFESEFLQKQSLKGLGGRWFIWDLILRNRREVLGRMRLQRKRQHKVIFSRSLRLSKGVPMKAHRKLSKIVYLKEKKLEDSSSSGLLLTEGCWRLGSFVALYLLPGCACKHGPSELHCDRKARGRRQRGKCNMLEMEERACTDLPTTGSSQLEVGQGDGQGPNTHLSLHTSTEEGSTISEECQWHGALLNVSYSSFLRCTDIWCSRWHTVSVCLFLFF